VIRITGVQISGILLYFKTDILPFSVAAVLVAPPVGPAFYLPPEGLEQVLVPYLRLCNIKREWVTLSETAF